MVALPELPGGWRARAPEPAASGLEGPKRTSAAPVATRVDDLTSDERIALSYIAPNLACVIEREPPKAIEETRRLARQELAWIMRRGTTQTDRDAAQAVHERRPHLIDGQFQSDKYPTTPRGKVPLSVKDATAQDLLWEYAQRRRAVDKEFADDLEEALRIAGYIKPTIQRPW
jgi:hypothetical protein